MTIKPAAPDILGRWLAPFEALFTGPTWRNLLVRLAGAILAPGRRTVTSALSVLGLRSPSSDLANAAKVPCARPEVAPLFIAAVAACARSRRDARCPWIRAVKGREAHPHSAKPGAPAIGVRIGKNYHPG